ncbi:MAG: transcription antitermination factor NusB [Spirochaetia bacterium]|nr:transcription antitermination factor NusB [Spirochaetia bacterium]
MGARHSGRVVAVQALYNYEMSRDKRALSDFRWTSGDLHEESLLFARMLAEGTFEHLAAIDKMIFNASEKRDFDRIARVDLAVLRVSIYEMCFQAQPLPSRIVIDEAIEISKSLSADESYKFVNGILDKLSREADR